MTLYRGPGGTGSATSDADTSLYQDFLNQTIAARDAALAAQTAAELAETNAETAETNAETAETNAETAETNAAASASAAATSASNASSSASAAATSASNAASSASAASTSASNASSSASAAAASAAAALTSETNAETAETNAETAEINAAASAALANDWATKTSGPVAGGEYSAKYHAQQAATSASNASTSASNAATSASNAATSATNASNSASSAATSATNAANSATAAANSATAAAASATEAANTLASTVKLTGDQTIAGTKTFTSTISGSINGNAATVTNGVYTTGDQTIGGTKTFSSTITGSISGNAGTVTNGVYTTGSYADPTWITSIAGSKVTGNISGNAATATTATNVSGGTASVTTLTTSSTVTHNGGTANGVAYLNGSKVLTSGSALTFDGNTLTAVNTSGNAIIASRGGKDLRFSGNYAGANTHAVISTTTGMALAFMDESSEFMRLTSTGLGIGTSSPGRKLDVYGAGQFKDASGIANTIWSEFSTGVAGVGTNNNYPLAFVTNGTERARITSGGEVYIAGTTDQGAYNLQVNGTGVWGAGAYVNGSDERLKDNIQTLNDGLAIVSQLRPVTFQYKPEYSKDQSVQPGFIAQELQQAMAGKDYVDGVVQAGPEYLNVAYQSLIPVLVKAIQELNAKVEAQAAEIAALKGQA